MVIVQVGADRGVEVGERESEHAAMTEHSAQLFEDRHEVRIRDHRQGMDAHDVVKSVVVQREAAPDVATDVDARVVLQVGVDPTRLRMLTASPIETPHCTTRVNHGVPPRVRGLLRGAHGAPQ